MSTVNIIGVRCDLCQTTSPHSDLHLTGGPEPRWAKISYDEDMTKVLDLCPKCAGTVFEDLENFHSRPKPKANYEDLRMHFPQVVPPWPNTRPDTLAQTPGRP